jgi:hypothetical protein
MEVKVATYNIKTMTNQVIHIILRVLVLPKQGVVVVPPELDPEMFCDDPGPVIVAAKLAGFF